MNNKTMIRKTLECAARPQDRKLMLWVTASLVFCCACGGGPSARNAKVAKDARGRVRPVPVSSVAPEPVTLESVNRRWTGARCQIRTEIEIKKGRDGAGWSYSNWLNAPVLPGEKQIKIRLSISNRDALVRDGHLKRNRELRAGAAFIAIGWRFADPSRQKGIVMDLRFESLPVEARMEFKGAERLEDLEDAEQLARIELFQLHEGSQQTAVTNPRASSPQLPSAGSQEPSVTIVTAAVEPRVAERGSEVELVITYTVGGVDPVGVQVSETRELRRGDSGIGTFNDTKTRLPGTYTSSHKIRVTPGTSPGLYTFKAAVSLAGKSSEASATFEVR